MNLVEIYSGLADQIVVPNDISVPDLDGKHIRVHVLGFWRVVDGKLHSVVEVANRSACPMCVSLLKLVSANSCSHKYVIRLHFDVLEDAVVGFVNNYSQLISYEWRRLDLMSWSIQPLFLFNQFDKGF